MMSNTLRYLVFCFLSVSLIHCSSSSNDHRVQHVIVIGIDGLSPDGVQKASTPNLDIMIQNGASSMHARGVIPTSSSPNWASMIMGAGPEQHGITSNGWRAEQHILPTSVSGDGAYFPTIFRIIQDQKPDYEVGTVYHWTGFHHLFNRQTPDYEINGSSEDSTTILARDYILSKKPNFLFVHIDHVDGAGHGQGHGSPAYYESVTKADSLIGRIRDAVKEAGIWEASVIIVSSDHGGVGFGHGGESLAEIEIPWIIEGKGIKKNHSLHSTINTFDTPATAAYLLGIQPPQAWIGRPVMESFIGENIQKSPYSPNHFALAPVISPDPVGNEPPGGLFVGGPVTITIENPNDTGSIFYTIDGSTPSPQSTRYSQPIELDKSAVVRTVIVENNAVRSEERQAYVRIIENGAQAKVDYQLYYLENPVELPDFNLLEPVSSGKSYEISIDDIELPREENIGMIFSSVLTISETGEYTFYLASDDGSKLFLNNSLLIDNDGDHGVIEKAESLELAPGTYPIKVEWFNGGGGKWLGVFMKGPNGGKQLIEHSNFN
jgi:hypothetical protein